MQRSTGRIPGRQNRIITSLANALRQFMNHDPANEPPIDLSLNHYMEEEVLTVAQDKAETETAGQRAKVEVLVKRRITLMELRASFTRLAVARLHARGEVCSKARVAAINAMGPTRASMDASVKSLYLRQPDSQGVLKIHAHSHFTTPLASLHLGLALMPADLMQEARAMQAHEEVFATVWIAAVDDPDFALDIRQRRREAMVMLRTATRPREPLHNPSRVRVDRIGMGCKADFAGNSTAIGKKFNAADRPSPGYHGPQGVMQRLL